MINEYRYPDKAMDYNKLDNADDFWGWNADAAAQAAGMVPLGPPFKRVADIILYLNKLAYAWKSGMHESGDETMSVNDFRKSVREELEKVYKKKIAKDGPTTKTQRTEEKDDEVKLNAQADEQMKRDGSSKPTDAEWKKMRTAQLEAPVPTAEERQQYENEMMEGLEKDLPKIAEECKKLGDRELYGLVKDAMYTYAEMHIGRKKVRYYEMKNSLAAIAHRLISLSSFKKSNDEKDDKKINKGMDTAKELIKKYLKKQELKAPKKEKIEEQSIGGNTGLKELLNTAAKYLEHPDVAKIPFSLPASAIAKRLRDAAKTSLSEEFDSWVCMECHYKSPKRFNKCPRCGSQEIENLG